jgi:hypothetical protein
MQLGWKMHRSPSRAHLKFSTITAWLAVAIVGVIPATAQAHGLQGRADLPVPVTAFYWAAAVVLIASFVGLSLGWSTARWNIYAWRPVPQWLDGIVRSNITLWVVRTLVLAMFLLTAAAAALGSTEVNRNLAPNIVWVGWVVGLVPLALLFGNVIKHVGPWTTLAAVLRIGQRGGRAPYTQALGIIPATVSLLLLATLELCVPTASTPRTIAVLIAGYTLATLAAMYRYGAQTWLERGELFSVYSGLIARMSIWELRTNPEGQRRLGLRPPMVGTTTLLPAAGQVLFITAMIGSVGFDGLSRSDTWNNIDLDLSDLFASTLGLGQINAGTCAGIVGLAVVVAFSYCAFRAASYAADAVGHISQRLSVGQTADAFVHSLLPIAAAYAIAHYFSYFVFQGQDALRLLSDPFGGGHDFLGTADYRIDYTTVSANAIWGVQVGAIVIGHVIGLLLAHDRALQIAPGSKHAVRSQYAMLALMVVYTVGGLWSLAQAMG